jgi:hypothetical protein
MYCLKMYEYIDKKNLLEHVRVRTLKTVENLLTFHAAKLLRKEKYKKAEIFPIDRIRV